MAEHGLGYVVEDMVRGCREIANAITPVNALPAHLEDGKVVRSLTEAVLAVATSLDRIAHAIVLLAEKDHV